MKKYIKGKSYDTEKANKIDSKDNGYSSADFNYAKETLYQKKTGEFFLHGEGHARTRYARVFGDGSFGYGEAIIPLSYESARDWAETNCSNAIYQEIFGEIEDGESSYAQYYISAASQEKAKRAAIKCGIGVSTWIERVIDQAATEENPDRLV